MTLIELRGGNVNKNSHRFLSVTIFFYLLLITEGFIIKVLIITCILKFLKI